MSTIVGLVMLILVGFGVLAPVLGLVGSLGTVTDAIVHVPAGRIAAVLIVGSLVAVALWAVSIRIRFAAGAWAMVIIAVLVAVYPLFAVASLAVNDVRDIIPWILARVRRLWH